MRTQSWRCDCGHAQFGHDYSKGPCAFKGCDCPKFKYAENIEPPKEQHKLL